MPVTIFLLHNYGLFCIYRIQESITRTEFIERQRIINREHSPLFAQLNICRVAGSILKYQ